MAPKGTIPPQYVESNQQRMALHQRALKIKTIEEIDEFPRGIGGYLWRSPGRDRTSSAGITPACRRTCGGFEVINIGKNKGHLIYHPSQIERFDPLRVMQLDQKNGLKLNIATKDQNVIINVDDRRG